MILLRPTCLATQNFFFVYFFVYVCVLSHLSVIFVGPCLSPVTSCRGVKIPSFLLEICIAIVVQGTILKNITGFGIYIKMCYTATILAVDQFSLDTNHNMISISLKDLGRNFFSALLLLLLFFLFKSSHAIFL